jgi:alpha-D-ribose 1-methylphosphonate 5-triphosphate synthase subunit PhnH
LLLGLLDADTPLWLSSMLAGSDAAGWLRFHTGCPIVADPVAAQFVWVTQGDEMPALSSLSLGSDAYPDQSATCVLEVPSLQADIAGWRLQGPGIAGERYLSVKGLPKDFVAQWDANHAGFPHGVDVFLCTATQIAGLPRTTRILSAQES